MSARADDFSLTEGALPRLLGLARRLTHHGRLEVDFADHDFILRTEESATDIIVLILGRRAITENCIIISLSHSRRLYRIVGL
jgi:hypothetical protein